jgi:hypothetical protein
VSDPTKDDYTVTTGGYKSFVWSSTKCGEWDPWIPAAFYWASNNHEWLSPAPKQPGGLRSTT